MKLLLLQSGLGTGGTEKIVSMIAAHRVQVGDDVHIAAMTCPRTGSYFDIPDEVSQHVLDPKTTPRLRRRGSVAALRRARAIRKLIRQEKPDLIISFLTKINVLTLLATIGTGIPVLVSERNNPLAQTANPIWHFAQNLLMRRATGIIMQTDRARADLPLRVRKRARIIANPCAPHKGLKKTHGTPGEVRFAAVGRLTKQKGFDLLLQAIAPLKDKLPHFSVTIHGEGQARKALEAQRSELGLEGIVHLPGASETPGAWLETADVLILSSRFEGFPNVVAEAVVNGLPVVAYDCSYGPREIVADGLNGVLVQNGDVAQLSKAIERLATCADLRQSLGSHADWLRERLAPRRIMLDWDGAISAAMRSAPDGIQDKKRQSVQTKLSKEDGRS